jgi:3-oxoacyl-[acyl-carrier-protein] synthase II
MVLGRNIPVVTGLGAVAPGGIGAGALWQSLLAGKSGIGRITLFDASDCVSQIAGEVRDFDILDYCKPKTSPGRMARQSQFAVVAALQALSDAGIGLGDLDQQPSGPVPIFLGVSTSSFAVIENGMERFLKRGAKRISTQIVASSQPQQAASMIAEEVPFVTETHTLSSACPSGLEAIALASDMIRLGRTDFAIAGGADSPLSRLGFASLDRAGLASRLNDEPEKASRPFDRGCDSGCVSEGAGIVILESLEHALGRGANAYISIGGYGIFSDPDPEIIESGLPRSMEAAMAEACCLPQNIDFICAHGPGHPVLDRAETDMIKRVFRDSAYRVPITSVKGTIGNPLAGAGPVQLISCALALRTGIIPPIANHEIPAPGCDLDYVASIPRETHPRTALINAHGLGGGNVSMVVQKVDQ